MMNRDQFLPNGASLPIPALSITLAQTDRAHLEFFAIYSDIQPAGLRLDGAHCSARFQGLHRKYIVRRKQKKKRKKIRMRSRKGNSENQQHC